MEEKQFGAGDIIKTRKPHPCGGDEWKILWTGADVKIKCQKCGHVVVIDRETFTRRLKKVVRKAGEEQEPNNP